MSLYKCGQCDRSFSYRKSFEKHKKRHKGLIKHVGFILHKCGQCDKSFSYRKAYEKHKKEHTDPQRFYCNQCGKSFSHKGSLKAHRRLHTGSKPYHCDQCNMSFTFASSLIYHKRTHTKINSRNAGGERGKKKKHVDQEARQSNKEKMSFYHVEKNSEKMACEMFSCDHCHEQFKLLIDLNRHIQHNFHYWSTSWVVQQKPESL